MTNGDGAAMAAMNIVRSNAPSPHPGYAATDNIPYPSMSDTMAGDSSGTAAAMLGDSSLSTLDTSTVTSSLVKVNLPKEVRPDVRVRLPVPPASNMVSPNLLATHSMQLVPDHQHPHSYPHPHHQPQHYHYQQQQQHDMDQLTMPYGPPAPNNYTFRPIYSSSTAATSPRGMPPNGSWAEWRGSPFTDEFEVLRYDDLLQAEREHDLYSVHGDDMARGMRYPPPHQPHYISGYMDPETQSVLGGGGAETSSDWGDVIRIIAPENQEGRPDLWHYSQPMHPYGTVGTPELIAGPGYMVEGDYEPPEYVSEMGDMPDYAHPLHHSHHHRMHHQFHQHSLLHDPHVRMEVPDFNVSLHHNPEEFCPYPPYPVPFMHPEHPEDAMREEMDRYAMIHTLPHSETSEMNYTESSEGNIGDESYLPDSDIGSYHSDSLERSPAQHPADDQVVPSLEISQSLYDTTIPSTIPPSAHAYSRFDVANYSRQLPAHLAGLPMETSNSMDASSVAAMYAQNDTRSGTVTFLGESSGPLYPLAYDQRSVTTEGGRSIGTVSARHSPASHLAVAGSVAQGRMSADRLSPIVAWSTVACPATRPASESTSRGPSPGILTIRQVGAVTPTFSDHTYDADPNVPPTATMAELYMPYSGGRVMLQRVNEGDEPAYPMQYATSSLSSPRPPLLGAGSMSPYPTADPFVCDTRASSNTLELAAEKTEELNRNALSSVTFAQVMAAAARGTSPGNQVVPLPSSPSASPSPCLSPNTLNLATAALESIAAGIHPVPPMHQRARSTEVRRALYTAGSDSGASYTAGTPLARNIMDPDIFGVQFQPVLEEPAAEHDATVAAANEQLPVRVPSASPAPPLQQHLQQTLPMMSPTLGMHAAKALSKANAEAAREDKQQAAPTTTATTQTDTAEPAASVPAESSATAVAAAVAVSAEPEQPPVVKSVQETIAPAAVRVDTRQWKTAEAWRKVMLPGVASMDADSKVQTPQSTSLTAWPGSVTMDTRPAMNMPEPQNSEHEAASHAANSLHTFSHHRRATESVSRDSPMPFPPYMNIRGVGDIAAYHSMQMPAPQGYSMLQMPQPFWQPGSGVYDMHHSTPDIRQSTPRPMPTGSPHPHTHMQPHTCACPVHPAPTEAVAVAAAKVDVPVSTAPASLPAATPATDSGKVSTKSRNQRKSEVKSRRRRAHRSEEDDGFSSDNSTQSTESDSDSGDAISSRRRSRRSSERVKKSSQQRRRHRRDQSSSDDSSSDADSESEGERRRRKRKEKSQQQQQQEKRKLKSRSKKEKRKDGKSKDRRPADSADSESDAPAPKTRQSAETPKKAVQIELPAAPEVIKVEPPPPPVAPATTAATVKKSNSTLLSPESAAAARRKSPSTSTDGAKRRSRSRIELNIETKKFGKQLLNFHVNEDPAKVAGDFCAKYEMSELCAGLTQVLTKAARKRREKIAVAGKPSAPSAATAPVSS